MNTGEYDVDVAATNGRPQRLVCVESADGTTFRDQVNTNSATSRRQFIRRVADKFNTDEQDFEWLDDAITDEADEADARADAAATEGGTETSKNQATQIVDLAADVELFHDPDRDAFARFPVDDHMEVAGVRSKHFRRWLARMFYLTAGKAPSSQAMQDAISVLEGKAIFAAPQRPVCVRVAGHEGRIYIDLCNEAWQVAEVDSAGWRILDDTPVMFRRAQAMLPLPTPVRGGTIEDLRPFIHLDDDEWTLLVAWLVAALRPTGPYPVLNLQGEHGSGKSTACRMVRALVDPNTAMLRTQPREPRDLMIASKNGWMIALDNLSSIQAWQSDCLCRLSTGGGFSTRKLYENDEEAIFDAQRPVIINGIDDVATRADLLDRCLLVTVPRIEGDGRRPEADLWAEFERARPRILGALLSAVAVALKNVGSTTLSQVPRMADFAVWATAAEPGVGLSPGQFLAAYEANRDAGNEVALETSPVGKAVLELVQERGEWSGTATELLRELESKVDDGIRGLKSWPSAPRTLSNQVKRLAPNLREAGSDVEFHRTGRRGSRTITLRRREERAGISPSASSAPSVDRESSGFIGSDTDAAADDAASADARVVSPSSANIELAPRENAPADATDDADAGFPTCSRKPEWVEV